MKKGPEKLFERCHTKDEKVVTFIKTIQKFRCVWDVKDPNHNSVEALKESWKEIASTTGYRNDRAKFTWMRLKEKFKKVYRGKETTWPYYEELLFLTQAGNSSVFVNNTYEDSGDEDFSRKALKRNRSQDNDEIVEGEEEEDTSKIDGDYLFLVSLLPTFKKFPSDVKMQVRLKIQHLVIKEMYNQINENKSNNHDSVNDNVVLSDG